MPDTKKKKASAAPSKSGATGPVEAGTGTGLERSAGGIARLSNVPPAILASTPLDAFGADVTDEMGRAAPTFGAVLNQIGHGVARSQAALDRNVVSTAKRLSETKIDVVTEVVQELDEDGLPKADETRLVTRNLSLVNFVNPTVHEWRDVNLSMDLSMGEFDVESGVTFEAKTEVTRRSRGSALWGFVGWYDTVTTSSSIAISTENRYEADFSSGQVRLDALMKPRETRKFPVPAEVVLGPQIYFAQGSTADVDTAAGLERQVELKIRVLKKDGSSNPGKVLEVDPGNLRSDFIDDGTYTGNTTNADGEIKLLLKRPLRSSSQAGRRQSVRVTLGEMSRESTIII